MINGNVMSDWANRLNHDPIRPLVDSGDEAVMYFTRRDLLNEGVGPVGRVWELPAVGKILKKQRADGSWKTASKKYGDSGVDYRLVETWKQLRYLVDRYELDRKHPAIEKAAEYVFSCQSEEGDIRGMLANQYAPYYTGAIMSLLIKAGYGEDERIERGFEWLLKVRQDDGGWVIGSPGMAGIPGLTRKEVHDLTSNADRETAKAFDRSRPFSAAGTGMVIRAFAAHPARRNSEHAMTAAALLKSKFFKEDNWSSYRHPDNWVRFQFPFWWTSLISALDSISLVGFPKEDPDIENALHWLVGHQEESGLWRTSYSRIHKAPHNKRTYEEQIWITLAICRIFKRLYEK
jgi:hypothetical protein